MPRPFVILVLTALSAVRLAAQVTSSISSRFHGTLELRVATGRIDPVSGSAAFALHRWIVRPTPDSNGVFPSLEPMLVAVGEDGFRVEAGAVHERRKGVFVYRSDAGVERGVRSLRFVARRDGSYLLTLKLAGVELSRLTLQSPVCVPVALIIGDDDAFSGLLFSRASFRSRRLRLAEACLPNENWQWLERCGFDQPGC